MHARHPFKRQIRTVICCSLVSSGTSQRLPMLKCWLHSEHPDCPFCEASVSV
ncbi:hypothetical protein C8Q76DRAFT_701238 [Earliella scabrosa]|nr:hypothetical protein C8Q76DRAFT_701238 [Earliella scabrosa]